MADCRQKKTRALVCESEQESGGKNERCMKSVTFDLFQICRFSVKSAPEIEINKIKGRTSEKPQESPLPLYHHPLRGGSSSHTVPV